MNFSGGSIWDRGAADRVWGISVVARESGSDRKTIRKGVREFREPVSGGRIRKSGGGRKKIKETDPTLVKDLEAILEPKGDPMSLLQWTTKSLAHLSASLAAQKTQHQEVSVG